METPGRQRHPCPGDRLRRCPAIQDRLDSVLGVDGWQDDYECLPDGSVVCRLRLRFGNEWVTKVDVGSPSEQPDGGDRLKAAFSDALKRVGVKFGIGRYLYRLPSVWVDYDPKKKQFAKRPELPPWAMPRQSAGSVLREMAELPKPAKHATEPHTFPETGSELERRLADYDQDLSEQGLFAPGDLLGHVLDVVSKAGPKPGVSYGTDCRTWPARAIKLAIETTKAFEQRARANAARKQRTLNHIAGKGA